MLKTKRNMQDKKSQHRVCLIVGLVITFLLVGNITYTDARGKSPATISSKQHELKDIKTLPHLQLDFRLVGTITSEENSYAVIEDETTGKQSICKLGESINEATVLKIDKESIIVEKDGMAQVLRIKGGSSSEMLSGDVPPSTGVSEKLPYFEPGPGTSSALSASKDKPAHKGKPAFPVVSLPSNAQGEKAIEALADKLPEVAAWYGSTPEQFSTMLREDHTTWIDTAGHLFFVEEFPEHTAEDETPSVPAASFPYDQTFKLHSLPGSKKVIYIDFDGHTTTGTAWNSNYDDPIISPAYDLDGNPSSFSNAELDRIQGIWKLVAEDYAPFDVDVTTEDPGQDAITRSSSSDERYGTRVVMTVDDFASCGCGGFAYVGVFDYVGTYYKPAFVFNKSLIGAAEAVSHEVGHNLGLFHDGITDGAAYYTGHGSGATGWAPIMGVGFYKQLVQWSKGEYANANNTQDDIQIIRNNGVLLLTDDHGNDQASATALDSTTDGNTITLSGNGLIERRTDVDFFSFMSRAGDISISINPTQLSPNLNILAKLYNASGTLIASSNPVDSLPASINETSLPAGEYFVMIDGVGKGDPEVTGFSDYASLGKYTISGSVPNETTLISTTINTGDMDGNGQDDVIIDFGPEQGIWTLINLNTWVKLQDVSPEIVTTGDMDGNGQDEVIIDFGDLYGIWILMNNSTWVKLHDESPEIITTGDMDGNGQDEVIIDFGDPYGIWILMNNSTWVKLHNESPEIITTGDMDGNGQDEAIVDFGNLYGIWILMNNSTWVKLAGVSSEIITTGDMDGNGLDEVIVDGNDLHGIWILMNNSTWVKLHDESPEIITTGDMDGNGQDEVIIDVGDPYGIWILMNNSTWVKLHDESPETITTGDMDGNGQDEAIIDFGDPDGIQIVMNNNT